MNETKKYASASEKFKIQLKRILNERKVPSKDILAAVKEPLLFGPTEKMDAMFREYGVNSDIPRLVRLTKTRTEGRDILFALIEILAERAEVCDGTKN